MQTVEPSYTTTKVDTKFEPLQSIIQHVSGSPWTVRYYSQYIGRDQEVSSHQLGRPGINQQYICIEGLELKVEQPLVSAQNSTTKEFETTGSALVFAGMIPNKGDIFIADVGDGRDAVFTVLTSDRRTYLRNTVYHVTYELKDYVQPMVDADLKAKTVRTTRFVAELLYFDNRANLLSEDYSQRVDLARSSKRLLTQYMKDFFSNQHRTFVIPGQAAPTYDPWLAKFMTDLVDSTEHHEMQHVMLPSLDGNEYSNTTVWDCIRACDAYYLSICQHRMRAISTMQFQHFAENGGIYYTSFRQVLYPYDGRTDVDRFHNSNTFGPNSRPPSTDGQPHGRSDCNCGAGWDDILAGQGTSTNGDGEALTGAGDRNTHDSMSQQLTNQWLTGLWLPPAVPGSGNLHDFVPVTQDDHYIFTAGFYNKRPQSHMERLLLDLFDNETLDRTTLVRLMETVRFLPELERFYYTPILLAMVKVTLRSA